MIKRKSIALCVLLSFVTFGIYAYYWIYRLNEESRIAADDEDGTAGAVVILLFIVTCGVYGYYWFWKMGKRMEVAQRRAGFSGECRSILYVVLYLLEVTIVNYCLIQSDLNAIADGWTYSRPKWADSERISTSVFKDED